MKYKRLSRICYAIAVIALIVGASFHGFRMHPEDEARFKLGVAMGIIMITIFVIFFILGTVFGVIAKR